MIKIISGVYGYRDPDTGLVVPKTSKDKPFSLSPEQEERLVSLKVAEYVGADETEAAQEPPEAGDDDETQPDAEKTARGGAEPQQGGDASEDACREQMQTLLDEMSAKDLREYGKELGLTFKIGMTKAEMRELIEEALSSLTDEGGDDEEPPKYDAVEAVL